MRIQVALPSVIPVDAGFCLMRFPNRGTSSALAGTLSPRLRSLFGGMRVLVLDQEPNGDLVAYGRIYDVLSIVGLDLEMQAWLDFEVEPS
jgi:hypothetical protein